MECTEYACGERVIKRLFRLLLLFSLVQRYQGRRCFGTSMYRTAYSPHTITPGHLDLDQTSLDLKSNYVTNGVEVATPEISYMILWQSLYNSTFI